MSRRRRFATGLLALCVTTAACASGQVPAVVERFDLSRVEVTARFEPGGEGRGTVVAAFAPTQPDLHLYGATLPLTGIDGAGRPTRVDVVDEGWSASGEAVASVEAESRSLPGFDEPFPIYPAGPVTIRVPVTREGTEADADIRIELTFMACTDAVCFKPVVAHPMVLRTG